jgi:LacI family transcriptional regulator
MTLGVLRAIEEVGLKCPDDLALATFDDLPVSEAFRPHLTSVAQPTYEIGHAGANLLIERIQAKRPGRKRISIVLEPDLRIRESSGRPGQYRTAEQVTSPPA